MSEDIIEVIEAKESVEHCYRHPERETLLHCNRCERPICPKCAVATPTGYRCPECIHSQQKIFDTAEKSDYVVGVIIALVLSIFGSWIASFLGFFTLFVAPLVGAGIAEAVRWATRRRRSLWLFRLTTAAAAIGSLPMLLIQLLAIFFFLTANYGTGFGDFFGLLWQGAYTIMVSSTVYYRLAGTQKRPRY